MLIYGNFKKTKTLVENYLRLLNSGINTDEILFIVQNGKLKKELIQEVKKGLEIPSLTKLNIFSFFGLANACVLENYPLIENKIPKGTPVIIPHLCTLEASRYIFKETVDKLIFKGYNSKINLLHQLLRRQTLITLNALNDEEISQRTKILYESFSLEIKNAINMYKQKTLEFRAFDYLRQVQLFSYLYKISPNPYKYIFIDDADEITPALFEYLKYIKKDVKEFFIGYDPKGTSRKGYLCAFENNWELFLNESPIVLNDKNKAADMVFETVLNMKNISLENLKRKDFMREDEMIEDTINRVNSLINKGISPKDILIVIPIDDEYLKLYLNKIEANINFITGSGKIENDKIVSSLLQVLRLTIEGENYRISPYKLKGILGRIFEAGLNETIRISQEFEADFGEKSLFEILDKYKNSGKIEKFLSIKDELKSKKLSEILYALAFEFTKSSYEKINCLLAQLRDFEEIFGTSFSKSELLFQLENTIISENENETLIENAVNISTIQKAIDYKIQNKYTFILDSTNSNWMKQDIGPLYNAWVFQKNWVKKDFTLEDNIKLAHDKIARQLYKLFSLNTGEIYMYSCVYNFLGIENFKGIKHFFTEGAPLNKPKFQIIPREDQKPVLEYRNGRFAIMAVAGAGKTTILLALIMKLLNANVKAENIFVLTYMDSAVRTLKERIKASYEDLAELPNISTIHGLSMRILRENNNHAHLGLDVDFEIVDEIKRTKTITEILYTEGIGTDKADAYGRAISAYKNSKNKGKMPPSFERIYNEYQRALKSLNLIDYDDLLIFSVELLKSNSKIREYYQNLAHFVIEDEAQDSSEIQQELINIISKKYGNVIRCGDVNQAITGSFTNSDTKSFKNFIKNNNGAKMNHTARNATGIINAANNIIKNGLKIAPDSFLEIETKPVSGKNIIDPAAVEINYFQKEQEEKEFTAAKINKLFEYEKGITAGILTRTNREAEIWAEYIRGASKYKVTTKNGTLSNNPVFKTVLAIFNFISGPMNNKLVEEFARTMMDFGFYNQDTKIFDKLKGAPFILENNEDFAIWWDLRYFLELAGLAPYELAFKIGEFYFVNDKKQKANIAPISSITAKIYNSEGNFEDTLNKMAAISKRSFDFKLFEDQTDIAPDNEIKVVTLHKSKGDEFDYVFIPALNTKNFGIMPDEIKLKEGARVMQYVQNSKKSEIELKNEIIDENLRLFYVGITRAKRKLYLSCAFEYKFFGSFKKASPSGVLGLIEDGL